MLHYSGHKKQKSSISSREKRVLKFVFSLGTLVGLLNLSCGTTSQGGCPAANDVNNYPLTKRAYVVNLQSDELTVIDLQSLEILCQVSTGGQANHMADLNRDFSKVYISSSETDELLVVDAKTLEITKRIQVGDHPTHLTLAPSRNLLAVMNEDERTGAVSFIDTESDIEVKRLEGFYTPHFMRYSKDGQFGYVANLTAHHLTKVNLDTLEIDSHIALDGYSETEVTEAPDEGGFADTQIDSEGRLYAAHHATGKLLIYDTVAEEKVSEIAVGEGPWIAFAEHPFSGVALKHLVTNHGDQTVSLVDGAALTVQATLPGDEESYGVNYSPLTPSKAFVMNRIREDIAVVDTSNGVITKRIAVGGNTETAATTADGQYVVATVSGADSVVVIDVETEEVVKTLKNIGTYPWSVTIPNGQNYCH